MKLPVAIEEVKVDEELEPGLGAQRKIEHARDRTPDLKSEQKH